ncbi:Mitochondrial Carrier (MC) Family [Achlya hypogyna]|uniref:Mitochondrial Carrier (MC) Family n=1 Tax=Achlya hypogyna TaxID=1202772 RepID=A0A1V9YD46_ACHHY|nr:Mitochondrial Carrier (MC) Family [Achlya hypogyna]
MQREDPMKVRFAAGAAGATVAELATLPMDFSKVRMQTHGLLRPEGAPLGLVGTLRQVIATDGIGILWRGAGPAVTRQVAYYSVSMLLYTPLRDAHNPATSPGGYLQKIFAGGVAGAIGISIANPFSRLLEILDVVKVMLQVVLPSTELIFHRNFQADRASQGNARRQYEGMTDACRQLYATEGVHGFFRGIVPNMQRCFIVNGMEFGTYDQCKTYLVESGMVTPGLGATMSASLVAGFAGAVASCPLDVVKTTLMAQPTDAHRHTGVIACMRDIARLQGIRAFYKGFMPYWMREAPWCCIFFVTFEAARGFLRRPSSPSAL